MNRRVLAIGELRTGPGTALANRRQRRRASRLLPARAAGGLVLLAGAVALGVWLLRAPAFTVTEVASGPYRYSCEADLKPIFGAWLGRNIFTLTADEIRTNLGTLPWVRDVRVRRRLPDRVTVELIEWRPVAALAPTDVGPPPQDLVIREDGRVLPFPVHLDRPALPVLVGLAPEAAGDGSGQVLPRPWATKTTELLSAIEAVGLEAAGPVDFLVAGPGGFAIVMQSSRTRLLVGKEDFDTRLTRYLTAQAQIPAGAEVDLRFRDRISYLKASTAAAPTDAAHRPKERS